MIYRRVLFVPAILAFANPALAQNVHPRGIQPGGAAGHPAQAHPSQGQQHQGMTPEMRYVQMMQQFWYEQMLLDEMYRMHRARRGRPQTAQGTGQRQAGTVQSQHDESTGAASMRSDRRQPHSSADALTPGQTNGNRSKKDLHAKENPKEQRHRDLSIRKTDRRDPENPRRHQLGPDHEAIRLLRGVHERLHKADADYAGHRVRAMEHITAALRHLGAPPLLDSIPLVSGGNRPQWESDQILRDAIRSLNRVEGMLGTGAGNATHDHSARASVAEAVSELHLALRAH